MLGKSRWWTLLHPKTLYGVLEFINENPYLPASFEPKLVMVHWASVAAAIIGSLLVAYKSKSYSFFWLAILSPMNLATIYESRFIISSIHQLLIFSCIFRRVTDQHAYQVLKERIIAGRAISTQRFDLYLPPTNCTYSNEPSKKGFILLPGANVEYRAYSPVAALISDTGIPVAVMSMEPLRYTFRSLGSNAHSISQIAHCASSMIAKTTDQKFHIKSWIVGGHSMGGFAAMNLISELQHYPTTKPWNLSTTKIVCWASGTFRELVPDLSTCKDLKALFVFGKRDLIAAPNRACFNFLAQKIYPNRLVIKCIPGADHSGFAAYKADPKTSGIRTISLNEQHQTVAAITSDFIKRK